MTKCVQESVYTLPKDLKPGPSERTKSAVKALRDAHQKLLQADTEGGFIVVPGTNYKEKADAAILGNFSKLRNVKAGKVNEKAGILRDVAGVGKLATAIRASKGTSLTVFFTAKIQKEQ